MLQNRYRQTHYIIFIEKNQSKNENSQFLGDNPEKIIHL